MTRPTFDTFNEEWARRVVGAKSSRGVDGFLGIVVTEIGPGRLVAEMEVTKDLITIMGTMHGGCLSAMCDHVLGVVMAMISLFARHTPVVTGASRLILNSVVAAQEPGGMTGYITTPSVWSHSAERQPPCIVPMTVMSSFVTSISATSVPGRISVTTSPR